MLNNEERMNGDFHIHSIYSYDAMNTPKTILKVAKRKGLNVLAVTDHNTIRGGIYTKKLSLENKYKDSSVNVIVGAEILTDAGDIIGLNLSEEINSREHFAVIDEIHNQGGLAVLPHPYRDHTHIDEIAKAVDYIEIWNSRNRAEQNHPAFDLAKKFNKNMIVGSDAHLPYEIGNAVASMTSSLKFNEIVVKNTSCRLNIGASIAISKTRRILKKL